MNRPLVLACGALASELRAVLGQQGLGDAVDVRYLPAQLHNRPERIVGAIDHALDNDGHDAGDRPVDRHVLIGYADCGTGGRLDAYIERRNGERSDAGLSGRIRRLPGAHCYEMFAGTERFTEIQAAEPGTFYLTDFLARHFDALVWQALGLDRHPQLRTTYFGNYRRVVLLSQSGDRPVADAARAAADRLDLPLHRVHTGRDELAGAVRFVAIPVVALPVVAGQVA